MSKVKQALGRARYTMEFKVEAIRLAKGAQGLAGTARVLGVPVQTLHGWVTQHDQGKLQGAGDKPISAEQMELARLRAQCARLKMECDILKKATAYFARDSM
jgi:transposase